jgi:hypothetical protein
LFWKIKDLSEYERARLEEIGRGRNLGKGPLFYQSKHKPQSILLGLAIGLAILGVLTFAALSIPTSGSDPKPNWVLWGCVGFLPALWTFMLAVEWIRGAVSPLKPFILVTPKAIFKADYGFGELEGYPLREATNFTSADTYGNRSQKFTGRLYRFYFPQREFAVKVRDNAHIQDMEKVLAQAKSGIAQDRDSGPMTLPSVPGRPGPELLRYVTNPYGEFWLMVAGILVIGALLAFVGADIYGKFHE